MSDSIRDTFLALMKQGMTALEAYREFDPETWKKALRDEIDAGILSDYRCRAEDGGKSLLHYQSEMVWMEMDERDLDLAMELWGNGWTSETPHKSQQHIFQWYWRRPSRRPGKPGRRFVSTTQAYNAMRKESE